MQGRTRQPKLIKRWLEPPNKSRLEKLFDAVDDLLPWWVPRAKITFYAEARTTAVLVILAGVADGVAVVISGIL